ncbi:hypothetical protein [Chlorobium limicola]|nr:hypothetical protein [Chlorobium limicola]
MPLKTATVFSVCRFSVSLKKKPFCSQEQTEDKERRQAFFLCMVGDL